MSLKKNYFKYIYESELLENLFNFYGFSLNNPFYNRIRRQSYEKLKFFKKKDKSEFIDYIASILIEPTEVSLERKKYGEFYTPLSVVDYILDGINYTESNLSIINKKLIDLSCGAGIFLIRATERLKHSILNKMGLKDFDGTSVNSLKKIIGIIKQNIFGVDINPFACILAQLGMVGILFDIFSIIKEKDPSYNIPIFNIQNKNALLLELREQYDFIVGNPPYVFIRDIPEDHKKLIKRLPLNTKVGQYDYYQIFLELGIRLLKEKGFLGYIIPDSILALSNRRVVRKFIIETTSIKEIFHTGSRFPELAVSNIIIILQKELSEILRMENLIRIKIHLKEKKIIKIPQKFFKLNSYEFLIHLNEIDLKIIEYLKNNFPNIEELNKKGDFLFDLRRGVELGKKGYIVFCKNCKKYIPLPRISVCPECGNKIESFKIETIIFDGEIKGDLKNKNLLPFLKGINRYRIIDTAYIDISKKGINYKDLSIYRDRIIIRQLSQNNLICATYYKNTLLSSQSFYNLKIIKSKIKEFNNLYLLGLLNSILMSYFFIKCFGSYKKLFPRILIEKIKILPIKIPESSEDKEKAEMISRMVEQILEIAENTGNVDNEIQAKIDSLIFDLYEIKDKERKYISNFMKNL
ncbi:MAG: Eco57I restriction-modification methylase domain-containing protein [Promethearchaeia archaeon]